jgi:hypothetical protein
MGEGKRTEKTEAGGVGVLLTKEDALKLTESIDVKFAKIGEEREKLLSNLRAIEARINQLNSEAVALSGEKRLLTGLLEGKDGS